MSVGIKAMGAIAAVLAVGVVAGCSSAPKTGGTSTSGASATVPGTGVGRFYGQKPTWRPCEGKSGFQCTEIEVPLDYAKPDGRTIRLAVNRLPSTGSARRLGSLLTNPGGPGGSGLDYVFSSAQKQITSAVRARYDVIGIDPRGVGKSSPVRCLGDAELDAYYTVDTTPDTAAEKARLRTAAQQYASACQANSGVILPHISTVDAARDMDVVRAVLGDQKLNYLGLSYGTQLGQVYAATFPGKVGRMVLDSVVDPALDAKTSAVTQMVGVQRAFEAFVDDCVKRSDCPLGTDRAAGLQKVAALLKKLDGVPLQSKQGRPVNDADARIGLVTATYSPETWQFTRQSLAMAFNGDGSGLRVLADAYRERGPQGAYSNMQAANLAIGCLETKAAERTEKATDDTLAATVRTSPLFGGLNMGLPCAFWKVPPVRIPHEITAKGAGPILLVNNTGDNATPIEWARAVARRLDRAVLVTNQANGHGVYGRGPCVNGAVDSYLLDGTMPPKGTKCQDHGSLF
jgi:pimeloyl-ACP methyl ester carboxylesterase